MSKAETDIRRLVRGILGEATLADVMPGMETPHGVDTDIEGRGGLRYGDPKTTAWRRTIKKSWNRHADHALFQDPSKMQVVHYLGLYSGKSSLDGYFPRKTSISGSIPGIDLPNKNELSCYGYAEQIMPGRTRFDRGPYFTFKSYRVTFVSHADAATERLSKATKKDKARMAGSGLAKRPMALGDVLDFYPLDDDDIPLDGILEEVVIDNWIVDEYHGPTRDRNRAEALGLKFVVLT